MVNKLVEECNQTIDEVKLKQVLLKMKIVININFAYCTLHGFQYVL